MPPNHPLFLPLLSSPLPPPTPTHAALNIENTYTGPETAHALHTNLSTLFPTEMSSLPNFRFVEQYNPTLHPHLKSQDHAFVCTAAINISLNCPVDQVMARGIPNAMYSAITGIRDGLAKGARVEPSGWRIGWWVVYCEDEEREFVASASETDGGEGSSVAGVAEARASYEGEVSAAPLSLSWCDNPLITHITADDPKQR